MMLDTIDNQLRQYAKRVDAVNGEDAYHNAVLYVLTHNPVIQNTVGYYAVAIKRALWKVYRHKNAEDHGALIFLSNNAIQNHRGLEKGRGVKLEFCRKNLHKLTPDNLSFIGQRRTCKACKQIRERKHAI
jgi:hypothetical protein